MNSSPESRDSHYFSENPSGPSKPSEFEIEVNGRTLVLQSDQGVFSRHGLDKGTAVLLDIMSRGNYPTVPDGSFLADVGCGTGAIALTLAALYPACTVMAVDVNERARALCASNAKKNGLSNITVLSPEELDETIRYSMLWSNPPIRIGKPALRQLLLEWMQRLTENGTGHLVVSKNLGGDSLAEWLSESGFATKKLASSKGFRVFEVAARQ
jgi:16S rRNA (guanine1207-N2)-methyltransferase